MNIDVCKIPLPWGEKDAAKGVFSQNDNGMCYWEYKITKKDLRIIKQIFVDSRLPRKRKKKERCLCERRFGKKCRVFFNDKGLLYYEFIK